MISYYKSEGNHTVKGKTFKRIALFVPLFLTILFILSFVLTTSPASSAVLILSDLRITKITEQSLVVSWITGAETTGEIHYGTTTEDLGQIALDDRGASTNDDTHYVTLSGLQPDTTYYFDVYSNGAVDNNGGSHYTATTGPTIGIPSSEIVYGQVFLSDGTTPAEGCIVTITLEDANGAGDTGQAAPLSSLVESSGYWQANLAESRVPDLSEYFEYSSSGDNVLLAAQCASDGTSTQTVDTSTDPPYPSMLTVSTPTQKKVYLPLTIRGN